MFLVCLFCVCCVCALFGDGWAEEEGAHAYYYEHTHATPTDTTPSSQPPKLRAPAQHGQLLGPAPHVAAAQESAVGVGDGERADARAGKVGHEEVLAEGRVAVDLFVLVCLFVFVSKSTSARLTMTWQPSTPHKTHNSNDPTSGAAPLRCSSCKRATNAVISSRPPSSFVPEYEGSSHCRAAKSSKKNVSPAGSSILLLDAVAAAVADDALRRRRKRRRVSLLSAQRSARCRELQAAVAKVRASMRS